MIPLHLNYCKEVQTVKYANVCYIVLFFGSNDNHYKVSLSSMKLHEFDSINNT